MRTLRLICATLIAIVLCAVVVIVGSYAVIAMEKANHCLESTTLCYYQGRR